MGTGYTRQSAANIVTGLVVEAAPLNAEFNALVNAFDSSTGHSHDGTTGEGPKIALSTSLAGVLPVAHGGINAIHKIDGTTAPTADEDSADGYGPGSLWIDTTNDVAYICLDATVANAVWQRYQPYDAELVALAGLTSAADKIPYFTGSGTAAVNDFTSVARTLVAQTTQSAMRSTGLGLGTSATVNTGTSGATIPLLNGNNTHSGSLTVTGTFSANGSATLGDDSADVVVIKGTTVNVFSSALLDNSSAANWRSDLGLGSLATASTINNGDWSGTDLAVANGGTGASTAGDARTNLGLAIGSDVQAYDADTAKLDVTQTWSADQTFSQVFIGNGSEISPVLAFSADSGNNGFYRAGTNQVGYAANGTGVFFISTSRARFDIPLQVANGSVGSPAYSFDGDTDTGLFRPTTNTITLVTAGSQILRLGTSNIYFGDQVQTTSLVDKYITIDSSTSPRLTIVSDNTFPLIIARDSYVSGTLTLVRFAVLGSTSGTITTTTGSNTVYNTSSDYRFKSNIQTLNEGFGERLDAIRPVSFIANGIAQRGFIAHEFQEVYPQSVSGEKDAVDEDGNPEYQSMQASSSEVMADIIAELQSLRKRVKQLEDQINNG